MPGLLKQRYLESSILATMYERDLSQGVTFCRFSTRAWSYSQRGFITKTVFFFSCSCTKGAVPNAL